MKPLPSEITQLLRSWSEGNEEALDKLTPLIYQELHRVAHRYMARERPGHTLQTTALINEIYLRLVDFKEVSWQDRAHFFAVCARLMRRILTDFARSRRYLKRGGEAQHVQFDETLVVLNELQLVRTPSTRSQSDNGLATSWSTMKTETTPRPTIVPVTAPRSVTSTGSVTPINVNVSTKPALPIAVPIAKNGGSKRARHPPSAHCERRGEFGLVAGPGKFLRPARRCASDPRLKISGIRP